MSSRIKIAFIWDWNPEYTQAMTWQDGLAAALKVLKERGHDLKAFTVGEPNTIKHPYFDIHVTKTVAQDVRDYAPDVILYWGDMTRPNAKPLKETGIPMAICFAGGEPISYNTNCFKHIFVESQVYEDAFRAKGLSVSRAFGTNTELFKPQQQPKVFDTIFPATFAAWKRHDLYAMATAGLRSLAVGYMYETHETECWQVCLDNDVMVLPHIPHYVLPRLYSSARVVVVPSMSSGGSQRVVLEAMAMDLPTVVCDSDKFDFAKGKVFESEPTIKELGNMVRLALDAEVSTRQYIVDGWSEYAYADALQKGLDQCLN